MEQSTMFSENIININCCNIIKMPESSIQRIWCRKYQMQVSHVEKNIVEQSSIVPNSQSIRST